ncbi:MAG: hypothetical protein IJX99_02605 [Clostridia bacterium]|nr:hypothetical protein [Clostridia bacterium]
MEIEERNKNYKILLDLILKSRHIKTFSEVEECKLYEIIDIMDKCGINDFTGYSKVGAGTYSTVYKIGNKVIKIGLAKMNTEIIENSKVVKSYFKDNIALNVNGFKIVLGIEIQEFVKVVDNVEENKLYDIYKELRNENLIWTDVKSSNVGYINEDYVVIDVDSIYRENDPKITWFTTLAERFEERYKNGLSSKVL